MSVSPLTLSGSEVGTAPLKSRDNQKMKKTSRALNSHEQSTMSVGGWAKDAYEQTRKGSL